MFWYTQGSGEGELNDPKGVAVDSATMEHCMCVTVVMIVLLCINFCKCFYFFFNFFKQWCMDGKTKTKEINKLSDFFSQLLLRETVK